MTLFPCERSRRRGLPCAGRVLFFACSALLLFAAAVPADVPHSGNRIGTSGVETVPVGPTPRFAALMEGAMNAMQAGMIRAPINGAPDHDFAVMMIPHHQGAIDMAKAELLYGKNPVLRRLAQEIIVTQGSEIAVMQAQLDRIPSTVPTR